MTDRITEICAKLAEIGAGITGINQNGVFDPPPAELLTAHLPAHFTWVGAGAHSESSLGEMFVETTRRFYVQVAVLPLGQGNPNNREKLVRPLLQAALAQHRKYLTLSTLDWVEKSEIRSDSGVIILPEYGGKFIGFEIPIDITYIEPRTIAAGE